jgi:nucleoside-diphosphate-sugar epimerase
MKIVVAGASGVVGRRLVPLLVEAGHDVVGTSRSAEAQGIRGVALDVLDRQQVHDVLMQEKPEVVIHVVTSIPRALDPGRAGNQFQDNNRVRSEGTRNLVAAASRAGVRRVVAESYAHIYAPKGSWVKHEEDELNLALNDPLPRHRNVRAIVELEKAVLGTPNIEGVALRYGTLYGPGTAYAPDGNIAYLVRRRHYPIVDGGRGVTSFLHVDDAAAATALAAVSERTGAFNICDDEPAILAEWLPYYARLLNAPPPRQVPSFVVRALGREHFVYRATEQRGATNIKAKHMLKFKPRYSSWREGFRAELQATPLAA